MSTFIAAAYSKIASLRWRWRFCIVALLSILLGALLTHRGVAGWDETVQYYFSRWTLAQYHLVPPVPPHYVNVLKYYGSLWEFILGINTEFLFAWLRDPFWVRTTLNFSLYPITLFLTYSLLRRGGVKQWTAFLAIACLFGIIRFGGHALFNPKDFPPAAAYMVVSIALWVFLREIDEYVRYGKLSVPLLCGLGILSVIPFLLRPPMLNLFIGLLCLLFIYVVFIQRKLSIWWKLLLLSIPFLSGMIFLIAFYPPYWTIDLREWLQPLHVFQKYPWGGFTRVFGITLGVPGIPWWYSFAWIPVVIEPVALGACIIGFIALFSRSNPVANRFQLPTRFGRFNLSLTRWLWIIVIGTWSAILILKPTTIYDEERHILFLYPILFLLGALGLDFLKTKLKVFLAVAIIVSSFYSYGHWGKYSYVYKSPLIGDIHPDRFMGDTWAICINDGVRALKDYAPSGVEFSSYIYTYDVSEAQLKRLQVARFTAVPGYEQFKHIGYDPTLKRPHVVIAYRKGDLDNIFQDLRDGKARLLWQDIMPPGVPACLMVYYPGEGVPI